MSTPNDEKQKAFKFTIVVVGEGKDQADAWDDAKPMFDQYAEKGQFTDVEELK